GSPGTGGDGGPATAAHLDTPLRMAVTPAGDVYIVELNNHDIRRVDGATGRITRVAGTPGIPGNSGDGGPALTAQLNNPAGILLGADGTLYVADSGNQRIRVITPDGVIHALAGTGGASVGPSRGDGGPASAATFTDPTGLAIDSDGALLVADQGNNVIRRIAPDTAGRISPTSIVTTILCDAHPTVSGEG